MTITNIEAVIDSAMDAKNPGVKFGAEPNIHLGAIYEAGNKNNALRSIGNFDVTPVAGDTIVAVSLFRRLTTIFGGGGSAAFLSRCTRPADWVEAEVTWDEYKASTDWTDAGGDFDDTGPPAKLDYNEATATGWHELTGLKRFVTDAIDNRSNIVSIVIRLDDEDPGSNDFYSWKSQDNGSLIWYLEISDEAAGVAAVRMRHRW